MNRTRKVSIPFLILLFAITTFSQVKPEFSSPWKNKSIAIVLDVYHLDKLNWKAIERDKRVAAIIHKATEGSTVSDPKYLKRRAIAKKAGYKWGSYHLLTNKNIIQQAETYLAKIGNDIDDELLALDVECDVGSNCQSKYYKVTAKDIETFLKHIKQKTGRYPVLYANQRVVKSLSSTQSKNEIFKQTPLWYARYKKKVSDFPKGIWSSYTFWQFSSEINCKPRQKCLYRIPGTSKNLDLNVYNGTVEELREAWSNIGK